MRAEQVSATVKMKLKLMILKKLASTTDGTTGVYALLPRLFTICAGPDLPLLF